VRIRFSEVARGAAVGADIGLPPGVGAAIQPGIGAGVGIAENSPVMSLPELPVPSDINWVLMLARTSERPRSSFGAQRGHDHAACVSDGLHQTGDLHLDLVELPTEEGFLEALVPAPPPESPSA